MPDLEIDDDDAGGQRVDESEADATAAAERSATMLGKAPSGWLYIHVLKTRQWLHLWGL